MDDPMWIVLPRHHRLADRAMIALSELKNERWVQGCLKINEILEHYARLAGIEIHVSCNTTDYTFAQALIAAGVGIGLVPEVALVPNKDLVAIPLRPPHPSRFIGVVTRKRRPHPLIKDLLSAMA